jgi:hypothetical protein
LSFSHNAFAVRKQSYHFGMSVDAEAIEVADIYQLT